MPKILMVDDDPIMQLLYRNVLVQAGHEFSVAGNGAEALVSIAKSKPDLIFMDVIMPVMDGITALRELRKTDRNHSPVVIITANVREYGATEIEARLAGAAGLLTKPFSPAQLVAEIQKYLPVGK